LPPQEAAIAGIAARITDAPWTLDAGDFARAREVGLSDATLLHVVLQTALFNYLNRMADGLGIEFDYVTDLPPIARMHRGPLPRPERAMWPQPESRTRSLSIDDRPESAQRYALWTRYNVERDTPLSTSERSVVRRAVALALCDSLTAAEVDGALPASDRERRLAEYATLLTLTPWRLDAASLAPVRDLRLDDEAVLDLVALASFQNAASRIRLALAAS
jgi:alkylhydroperoxidase family enzyme